MRRPAILKRAEALLLDEKAGKLLGLTRVLDRQLGPAGFDGLSAPELRSLTDDLAAAFPRVGLGFYDAVPDRIVAYAPSRTLGYLVGVTPPPHHLGRTAMAERADKVAVGSMVRGDAMNVMHPLIRDGRVIGFAFANESLEDIDRQMRDPSADDPPDERAEYFERAERLAVAGELATAIAHEIRNPLTVVAGSIQLIPDRLHDAEFLRSFAEIAGEELGRVNRTIQGLLGFARYSEPQMQPVDVNRRVADAVAFIRWYAAKHGAEVAEELHPGLLLVHGDGEHLQQAIINLMLNGIQAMPGGGVLTVRTEHPPGSRWIRVSVRDRGVGIAPDQLPKIWEVFYSARPGGTGLGLPVVQRIVDEHQGYVDVESTPGRGACFTMLLPALSSKE